MHYGIEQILRVVGQLHNTTIIFKFLFKLVDVVLLFTFYSIPGISLVKYLYRYENHGDGNYNHQMEI